jgi:hypothetical protein
MLGELCRTGETRRLDPTILRALPLVVAGAGDIDTALIRQPRDITVGLNYGCAVLGG